LRHGREAEDRLPGGSGIRIGELGGITVDRDMRTNLHGVFAAGDCTVAIDFSTGTPSLNAVQPDAVDKALVAAPNITGTRPYRAVPFL
jgi:NADPH-dependent 2,4-dienoyl-CoA reductase/sulfur reductase-like enzyme